jgi:hypothetical protein
MPIIHGFRVLSRGVEIMHYAYTYPPNPGHWRELIRYVLPRIKHTTRPVTAPGGSLSQPTMVYLGDAGKTQERGRGQG